MARVATGMHYGVDHSGRQSFAMSMISNGGTTRTRRRRQDISQEELEEISEAFQLFDTDNDGCVEYRELKVALRALGFPVKKAEVKALMHDYDRKGIGKIDAEEFKDIVIEKILERDPAEEMAKAFQLFDEDNTGKITLKNLKKIAREIDEDIDEDELEDMIKEFDVDGDGQINEDEFYNLMKCEL